MFKSKTDGTIAIDPIKLTDMKFNLVGTTPLFPHAISAKTQQGLLDPAPRKNAAERATTKKHQPFDEYRDAAYRYTDMEADKTRLYFPTSSFKAALRDVAIDMVSAKKAQIGRLSRVIGDKIPLYGVPKISISMMRSSGMVGAPDPRSLPKLERWAIPGLTIQFAQSLLSEKSIANLLANAGLIIGVGDGRPQKGYFDYGTWRLAHDDDKELNEIVRTGGIHAQDKALADPEYADLETEKLLMWWIQEQDRRSAAPPPEPKRKKQPTPPPVLDGGNGKAKRLI